MSSVQGQAIFRDVPGPAPRQPSLGQRMYTSRFDYLYVAPALLVMLIVIAYPVYYTIELSFYKTPASLSLADKTFTGIDNYATVLNSAIFWKVTWQTII